MVYEIECERCGESFLFHTTENLIDFKLPKLCFKCVQKEPFNPELEEPYVDKL
jgi:formylmethanofuran dehydrogenase subunit E